MIAMEQPATDRDSCPAPQLPPLTNLSALVQSHLSEVLRRVEDGQEILITRRSRVIARLVPAQDSIRRVSLPDFTERSRRIWGTRTRGKTVSRLIIDERKERL